ncbi:MAG: CsbD family protein [Actinobacteria bacterium]|nr:CsbD family protein [Actinomycetota bacterium]MBV8960431.1 CsbD family protein [Actinomycetota bacterium]MBV9254550.1 CsbD family protein [Actinomycetota bacterium]MBV9665228.1 CsbD family protein [Actinomycetota bacterium]MBV9934416.1 CsbD family protein [Actinomycetota bacterium]
MASKDKMKNKAQEVKGKVKESAGRATGNDRLRAKGKADQAKGNLKQAGEKVKDALGKK